MSRFCSARSSARRFTGSVPRRPWRSASSRRADLVSNLDFVESIFGNAGDPYLPENDAGLDVEHWTGHTGCVILAPHLTQLDQEGSWACRTGTTPPSGKSGTACAGTTPTSSTTTAAPSRSPAATAAGVIVTIIADNYYGYCKKEVKTQISFAANLLGNVEEEHSGGALAFASYSFGYEFEANKYPGNERSLADVARDDPETVELRPEGYAIDRLFPDLVYIPGDARASIAQLQVWWTHQGRECRIPLVAREDLHDPLGVQAPAGKTFRRRELAADRYGRRGALLPQALHGQWRGQERDLQEPRDYMIYGPIFVADVDKDFDLVQQIFDRDYADRWKPGREPDYSTQR